MKKIFWLIVLLGTWYIISIFLAPTFADKIWDLLWIKSFNEQIRNKLISADNAEEIFDIFKEHNR